MDDNETERRAVGQRMRCPLTAVPELARFQQNAERSAGSFEGAGFSCSTRYHGIVSTVSLVGGVAAAHSTSSDILVAGVAGLVAGAMSMAAGSMSR